VADPVLRLLGGATGGPPGDRTRSATKGTLDAVSDRGWFGRLCVAANLSPQASEALGIAPIAAVVLVPVSLAVASPIVTALVAAATTVLPATVLLVRRNRRSEALAEAVPFVLDTVARSMRAGGSLEQAVRRARTTTKGPLAAGIDGVVAATELGQPLDRAWQALAEREDSSELRAVAALLGLLALGEGGGADALENAARAMRARAALHRETRALIAQAELSMRVLALLPAGFVVLGIAFGNESSMTLFRTGFGRLCLAAGIGLELAGAVWMKSLLQRAAR